MLPDIRAGTGYGPGMAPVRVRGCAGFSKPPGTPGSYSGKPMPGAGETAHVRRLFVDRSRCALEVSPAPRRVPMSLMTGRRAVVAAKSGETLSRRMWGRRPGRPDGWHADVRGFVVAGVRTPRARTPTRPLGGLSARVLSPRASPPRAFPTPVLSTQAFSGRVPSDAFSSRTSSGQDLSTWVPLPGERLTQNESKALFPSSGVSGNRVPGARDDPASDGYTHFQPSRDPEKNGKQTERG